MVPPRGRLVFARSYSAQKRRHKGTIRPDSSRCRPVRLLAAANFTAASIALLVRRRRVRGRSSRSCSAIRWAASFPDLPAPGPETSELGAEPPAIANLLVNRCNVTSSAAAATLIDLAARRHLELFEVGPDHFVVRLRSARGRPAHGLRGTGAGARARARPRAARRRSRRSSSTSRRRRRGVIGSRRRSSPTRSRAACCAGGGRASTGSSSAVLIARRARGRRRRPLPRARRRQGEGEQRRLRPRDVVRRRDLRVGADHGACSASCDRSATRRMAKRPRRAGSA